MVDQSSPSYLIRISSNNSLGSDWTQTQHSEGGLNFRSIIPWGTTLGTKYEGHQIAFLAATSIAPSYIHIGETKYAFVVCLDHRLRIWNFEINRIVYSGDMLNKEVDPNSLNKPFVGPNYSKLVKVYERRDEGTALCVTYSPVGPGEFKFWEVRAPPSEGDLLEVRDIFEGCKLKPFPPTADAWEMADFGVIEQRAGRTSFTLWILWRNNTAYVVHKLDFHVGNNVDDEWLADWQTVSQVSGGKTYAENVFPYPISPPGDSGDHTDKWLDLIMSPGKYTTSTIETGLAIYARGLNLPLDVLRKQDPLPQRMCATVASSVTLGRLLNGEMTYREFSSITDSHWSRFNNLLTDLDKRRGEALSLVIDPSGNIPWLVQADGATAIRDCSKLELIRYNPKQPPLGCEYASELFHAAAKFRAAVSGTLRNNFQKAIMREVLEEPSSMTSVVMRTLYDKCDFAVEVDVASFDDLQGGLGGRFVDITPQVYDELFESLFILGAQHRPQNPLPLTQFGNKLVVKGVQDVVDLYRNTCLDQLFLLILLEVEINNGDEGIGFDTAKYFDIALNILRRLELIGWLSKTQLSLPLARERSGSVSEKSSSLVAATKKDAHFEVVTVLEGMLSHLLEHDTSRVITMSALLTEIIVQICDSETYELLPHRIQCFLMKNGRYDLAIQFSPFTTSGPFDIYILGRAHLAIGDASDAAILFKRAAFGIGDVSPQKVIDMTTSGFLDNIEKNHFNAGIPRYYSHIVALYDKEKNFSYVIDFARLALQFIKPGDEDAHELRTEMHSRLFNAALQSSRFDIAHSTLSLFTDTALQHSSLRALITKMCESSQSTELIALPFLGLQPLVDELLAQKCQSISDVCLGTPYHKILYAWRVKHHDFRGAASISLERLLRLQNYGDNDKALSEDGLETAVTRQYLALINALSCVDPKQAWILSEEPPKKLGQGAKATKSVRKVVTLDDIRKDYQSELDRLAAIENNQIAFVGGDEMDIDIL